MFEQQPSLIVAVLLKFTAKESVHPDIAVAQFALNEETGSIFQFATVQFAVYHDTSSTSIQKRFQLSVEEKVEKFELLPFLRSKLMS